MANIDNDLEERKPLKKRLSLRFEQEGQYVVNVEPQQQVEEGEIEANRELPEKLKSKIMEMGGTEETLIMKKPLTKTDVDGGESRLSIPMSKLLNHDFLTSDEKIKIHKRIKRDREGGLSVEVIDPKLHVWKLKIRGYDDDMVKKKKTRKRKRRKTSSMYLLAYKWNHVVKANSLIEGNNLQLWSFRSQQKLCLALVFH
ncbi:DNA-binding pseudobarrel domain superfamily [Arabidopsis suecica]|uniref:DNA-binding pseudobarrel domain superfamily n=1 Tax=Arabidopsis suecica TaxID=45249 RepID=A0A8T2APV8_ARASU|nr:DNA-binding pseudobarrel domain superfamily [Arabidopsis suecica]